MLEKNFLKQNARDILDECKEDFEDGEVCECYLQGASDALNQLIIRVLGNYYDCDCEEKSETTLDELTDVILDLLAEDGATLSELSFAEKILSDYMCVALETLTDEDNEYEEECPCKLS